MPSYLQMSDTEHTSFFLCFSSKHLWSIKCTYSATGTIHWCCPLNCMALSLCSMRFFNYVVGKNMFYSLTVGLLSLCVSGPLSVVYQQCEWKPSVWSCV